MGLGLGLIPTAIDNLLGKEILEVWISERHRSQGIGFVFKEDAGVPIGIFIEAILSREKHSLIADLNIVESRIPGSFTKVQSGPEILLPSTFLVSCHSAKRHLVLYFSRNPENHAGDFELEIKPKLELLGFDAQSAYPATMDGISSFLHLMRNYP